MQSGLASGSSEIVMCINVVAHRGHGCLTGRTTHQKGPQGAWLPHGEDNSPKRPTGGMAASRGGQLKEKRPTGGMAASRGGQLPNGLQGAKCITGRTHINGPQRTKMPVMEERNVKNASLGGHPSTAHRGQNFL